MRWFTRLSVWTRGRFTTKVVTRLGTGNPRRSPKSGKQQRGPPQAETGIPIPSFDANLAVTTNRTTQDTAQCDEGTQRTQRDAVQRGTKRAIGMFSFLSKFFGLLLVFRYYCTTITRTVTPTSESTPTSCTSSTTNCMTATPPPPIAQPEDDSHSLSKTRQRHWWLVRNPRIDISHICVIFTLISIQRRSRHLHYNHDQTNKVRSSLTCHHGWTYHPSLAKFPKSCETPSWTHQSPFSKGYHERPSAN